MGLLLHVLGALSLVSFSTLDHHELQLLGQQLFVCFASFTSSNVLQFEKLIDIDILFSFLDDAGFLQDLPHAFLLPLQYAAYDLNRLQFIDRSLFHELLLLDVVQVFSQLILIHHVYFG